MPWLQLSLDAGTRTPDDLADVLSGLGAVSVTFQDAADQPLYEPAPGDVPLWNRTRVVGLFPADTDADLLRAALDSTLGTAALGGLTVETLEDRDWVRAWMDDFRPMRFGTRLWVCPTGFAPPDPAAVNLLLDPGLAFGTGTHPTTALCLEWLDAHPCAGEAVIDFGCGSGILAIAAARLGAQRVWAVDNDPQALTATRDNAAANGVAGMIDVMAPEALPDTPVDTLLANILAGPLQDLAGRFAALVRPGGRVVLSGVLAGQAAAVAAAYDPWFGMEPAVARDGWVRLTGRRGDAPAP